MPLPRNSASMQNNPPHSYEMSSRQDQHSGSDSERLQADSQAESQRGRHGHPSSTAPQQQTSGNGLGMSTYWEQPYAQSSSSGGPESPIDPSALQFALPPEINQPPPIPRLNSPSLDSLDRPSPYFDEATNPDYYEDRVPLTSRAQPISGSLSANTGDPHRRDSFQTVSDLDNTPSRTRDARSLGYDLEPGGRRPSYGATLSPGGEQRRSRSPSTAGALYRAGSIMRAMSQRVVNISGEGELVDHRTSRSRSPSPAPDHRQQLHNSAQMFTDPSYHSHASHVPEKAPEPDNVFAEPPPPMQPRVPMKNPLKGNSLGIFPPDHPIRTKLCDLLVHPLTEPFILILIILQAILLAVESAPDVFIHPRPATWGVTWIDWAMLVLFVIFTLELIARILVSGFLLNASEYSTIDRQKGVRAAVVDQYRNIFQPQRQRSVKAPRQIHLGPSAFQRSFTIMQGQTLPQTVEEQQRFQLARRAFLRHSFNRLDFLAVVAYWISFALRITGIESEKHLYVFRMIACLRILRLLALTNGTAIILRSLKKAAPLLVRVAFLIAFFWILFAIIGVQSFKASLSRQCVWLDPTDPTNREKSFTNEMQFCGGFLDNETGKSMPWVLLTDENVLDNFKNGRKAGKGFLCPRGSICLQQENPYNSTVSFDNIAQSLEMVFVIISSNTFSDIMYYTTNSDYLPAALFFGAGIMILMLWLVNLLIAVITSSFQVIREESRASAFTATEEPPIPEPMDEPPPKMSALQRICDKTSLIWIAVIAFGLLAQAFRSSRMSNSRGRFIDSVEVAVTLLLDVEIIIRIAAGWRTFHRSKRNIIDFGLAVITTIILIPPIRNSGETYAWLTVFQIVRVYRLVLAVPMTRKLIVMVLGNSNGIANLMLFVFLITFLMAILAAQLFRGEIPKHSDDGDLNEVSFFTIYNSFLGMYQILSSEDWTSMLYNVTSHMNEHDTGWIGAVFLVGWFILSFFILVNMFIAVIQENFDVSEDEKRLEQVKAFLQRKELGKSSSSLTLSNIFTFGKSRRRKDPLDYGPAMMEMLLKDAVVHEFLDDATDLPHDGSNEELSPTRAQTHHVGEVRPGILSSMWGKVKSAFSSKDPNPFYSNLRFDGPNDTLDPRQMARQAVSATSARKKAQRDYLARHPNYNNSLFIFTPNNPIRRFCQRIVGPGRGNERFEGVEPNKIAWYASSAFIYACIVAMVVIACVTTPLYQKQYQAEHPEFSITFWYVWTDLAFAVIFSVEAVIKVIADGFFFTPNAYYRSSWGFIDGIVLITLLINVGTLLANDGAVSRAIGAFKALRALRLLNVSDSARDTFHSLIIVGGWKILSAAFVSISLLIPFAIYGLNLFNGQMISCNDGDDSIVRISDCFGEFNSTPFNDDWPMLAPRVPANDYFSFDDFASSLFILFQIVSQEGWIDVMFAAQAVTGRGLQPKELNRQGNAMFFVVFNLLATVFVLTLFISVFMRNYTEQTGVAFLTAEQRSWLELRKLLRQISPSKSSYNESEKTWKKWCHKRAIEKRGKWYTAVTYVLICHLLLLLLEYHGEPQWWTDSRDGIFLAFTLVYMTNIAIRITGLGWARFRRSSWDLYSLVVVTGAFVSTSVLIISRSSDTYVQLHKFFLVAILLLLIPRNDALDQLFKTAAASLTTIGNLLATWLVFFLVFAIALTQAFSLTRFGENEEANINFRSVPNALILLFRMSCGEGWNQVMEDYATIEPPLCVDNPDFFDSDCGSKPWARFLFVAWNILSMYIFVNLFVSLIYESFSYVYQRSSGLAAVDRDEIRRFKEAWRSVDPAGTGFISKEAFPRLLGELSGVFEMRIYDADDSVRQILEDVRNDAATTGARHMSIASASNYSAGVDIQRLNRRLAQIDVDKVRERRRRFNIFFEEVMVSADPDKGISFTSVLMILAHYNIINDSKSLKLEEFLRRRARLQRVEEEVRRRVVLGFFDTLYWTRKFKKHIDMRKSARMTAIPQLDIPHILVDDDELRLKSSPVAGTGQTRSALLTVDDANKSSHNSWSGPGPTDLPSDDYQHPLSLARSGPTTPGHQSTHSAFSFELQEGGQNSAQSSRRGSAVSPVQSPVSPAQVNNMLDDSIWLESIRRTATVRKSVRKSDWGR
ncbi:Putative EF-hand domain, voltage-dependent calcium channel, alpha-1 subunit, Ion transport [Colletotrichum destructivum]|uniref:Calcium-channel protein CCH1 n=1 Tax=Colletotrichum destructivum TaxID=34406 RepID=A0AAX4IQ96_9PEZI|nr:Putative EF-hand domain, voltage-dependent calcium channel, alpha-1 subunit, Ion transport [Colletotrichum destructivum]